MSEPAATLSAMGHEDRLKALREMWPAKAAALIVVPAITAGAAAVGAHITTDHYATHATGYAAATYDHADPYHSDPSGEFTHLNASPTIGTASVNFNILGTSD
jgi:hypothetical protein